VLKDAESLTCDHISLHATFDLYLNSDPDHSTLIFYKEVIKLIHIHVLLYSAGNDPCMQEVIFICLFFFLM